ncbi:hypothetical protein Bbelb_248850 [Branchiostoma belcheri]|nr:hypothetical protein Bbelb_248850 [Branchiostoma belcheri]
MLNPAEWDLWSSWSYCPCNAIPNLTKRARWRGCIDGDHLGILYVDDFNCGEGETTQTKLCQQEDIPASYYEWSSWGDWTPCPSLCLHDPTVITSRYRVCTYIYNGQLADHMMCGLDFYQSEACPKVPYVSVNAAFSAAAFVAFALASITAVPNATPAIAATIIPSATYTDTECNDSYVPLEFDRTPCYEEGAGTVFYKGCAQVCTCADNQHFSCEDMCSNLPSELFQYDQNGCRYVMKQPFPDMPYSPETCCPHLECDPAFAAGNCPDLTCEATCIRGYRVERGYDGCLRCSCLNAQNIAEDLEHCAADRSGWRNACTAGLQHYTRRLNELSEARRAKRHLRRERGGTTSSAPDDLP